MGRRGYMVHRKTILVNSISGGLTDGRDARLAGRKGKRRVNEIGAFEKSTDAIVCGKTKRVELAGVRHRIINCKTSFRSGEFQQREKQRNRTVSYQRAQ